SQQDPRQQIERPRRVPSTHGVDLHVSTKVDTHQQPHGRHPSAAAGDGAVVSKTLANRSNGPGESHPRMAWIYTCRPRSTPTNSRMVDILQPPREMAQ